MDRCNGQVQGVSCRVGGHDVVRDVGADRIGDSPGDFEQRKVLDERERRVPMREIATLQLIRHGVARQQLIA